MNNETIFIYNYSASNNKEVQEIRSKYIPHEESKFDELKRLDETVQRSGIIESLCAGISGVLMFGLGLCLAMQVIAEGVLAIVLGALFGIAGIVGIIIAYPIQRKMFLNTKSKLAPRILELSAELSSEKNKV